jgi:hypothetical protein
MAVLMDRGKSAKALAPDRFRRQSLSSLFHFGWLFRAGGANQLAIDCGPALIPSAAVVYIERGLQNC